MNFEKIKSIKEAVLHKGQMFIPLVCVSSFFLVGYAAMDKEAPVIADDYVVLNYGDKFDVSMVNIADNRTSYDDLLITCDTSTLRESVVGSSYVTVEAIDEYNNTASKVVEVRVEDHVAPNFELVADSKDTRLEDGKMIINLNSSNTITDHIKAIDNADGDVTAFVEVEGTLNTANLDPQTITLSVSDASGNVNKKTFDIQVKDIEAPVIHLSQGDAVTTDFGNGFHISDFATVSDNSGEEIEIALSNDIDTSKEETQTVTLTAVDSAGNKTEKELKVGVGDISAPIINASDIEIEKGDALDIRSQISVIDNKDGDLTAEATIDGSVDTGTAGDYSITISAKDAAGNEATKTINVRVNAFSGGATTSIGMSLVGSPYVFGATGPSAFDCSGFTSYVFAQAGISIGRTTFSQYAGGTPVSDLQPGDLVFFNTYTSLGHVGIYLGGGMMVHSGNESTGVEVTSMGNSYWSATYAGAVRY